MTIRSVTDARAASAVLTSVDGVRLLHWPDEDGARAELAAADLPRILLLAADAAPPEDWDELEDWVRLPLDPDELHHRARTLRRRARATDRPWFDDDGLLRVGDRWLDLPAGPRTVVELLVARFGRVVYSDELAKTYLDAGGSPRESARKTMIVRVRHRLADLGLELHNIRDSGYLLDWADDPAGTAGGEGATFPSGTCVAS
jgi:DNA-binding response OmpR family regulator